MAASAAFDLCRVRIHGNAQAPKHGAQKQPGREQQRQTGEEPRKRKHDNERDRRVPRNARRAAIPTYVLPSGNT